MVYDHAYVQCVFLVVAHIGHSDNKFDSSVSPFPYYSLIYIIYMHNTDNQYYLLSYRYVCIAIRSNTYMHTPHIKVYTEL